MKKVFATTSNAKRLNDAMSRLTIRDEGVPGMGLLYGEPGLGKTKSTLWWAAHNDGIFVRTKKLMTGRWLLEEIVAELGEAPAYRTADLFRQIRDQLLERPRAIFIDEVDYFDARMIETLRDVYDETNAPLVLIGMGQADKKMMRYKHLWDRLSEVIKFNELTQADIAGIAGQLCEVPLTEDAIAFVCSEGTRFRRVMIWLYRAEAAARRNKLTEVTAAELKGIAK
jgi:DNA transposition AAA+ family ATPase